MNQRRCTTWFEEKDQKKIFAARSTSAQLVQYRLLLVLLFVFLFGVSLCEGPRCSTPLSLYDAFYQGNVQSVDKETAMLCAISA